MPLAFSKSGVPDPTSVPHLFELLNLLLQQLQDVLRELPYACNLGTQIVESAVNLECVTPWRDSFTGNPLLLAWHGGIVAGVLELTAMLAVLKVTDRQPCDLVSINVNYLKPSRGEFELHSRAFVVRRGRQMLYVDACTWQESVAELTSQATLIFSKSA